MGGIGVVKYLVSVCVGVLRLRCATPSMSGFGELGWLEGDYGVGVSRVQGVHVGEDEVPGAVASEGGLVFAADNGASRRMRTRDSP